MTHNTNTKKLLQEQPHALRALHDILRFDFEKPHTVQYIKGAYTAKKVLALADETGYINPLVAVLTQNKNDYWKDLRLVTVNKYGKIEIDYPAKYYQGKHRIDYFFRKSDFEAIRKKADTETYIIIQSADNLTPATPATFDRDKRYIYIPSPYERAGDGHGNTYINRIKIKHTGEKGTIFEFKTEPGYYYNKSNRTNDINDIIDKSGYLLQHRRQELKRKAAALRAERQKAAYLKTDNTDKITELSEKIQATKSRIIEKLTRATTSEQLHEIGKILYWSFARIVLDFERYRENTAQKAYSSIERSENAYNEIIKSLDELEV